jgi:hypothetical protein
MEKKPLPLDKVGPPEVRRGLALLGCVAADANNKALTTASRARDWLTRLGVALHPTATDAMLELLTKDADADVAAAAQTALQAKGKEQA